MIQFAAHSSLLRSTPRPGCFAIIHIARALALALVVFFCWIGGGAVAYYRSASVVQSDVEKMIVFSALRGAHYDNTKLRQNPLACAWARRRARAHARAMRIFVLSYCEVCKVLKYKANSALRLHYAATSGVVSAALSSNDPASRTERAVNG